MNSQQPQVRACWRVLADQAQEKVARIQAEVNQIRTHIDTLELSHERVVEMYNDYINPASGLQVMKGMQEMQDARQFANQMLELMQRIRHDIGKSQKMLNEVEARRIKADQERLKMEALLEQDQRAVNLYHQKKEQALMDATGLMQFNLGARG